MNRADMNPYEQHVADRREALKRKAERLRAEATALHKKAHEMAAVIPLGQPIIVGHHSEGRDRRYRERISGTFAASFEAYAAADTAASAAASVGTAGISSDDPDAVAKLEAKLAGLQEAHNAMIASNAAARRGEPGAVKFPDYRIRNHGAVIRSTRKRIDQLTAARAKPEIVEAGAAVTLHHDVAANRLRMIFAEKPGAEIRNALKAAGFRWAPSSGDWRRHLTPAAIAEAKRIEAMLVVSA